MPHSLASIFRPAAGQTFGIMLLLAAYHIQIVPASPTLTLNALDVEIDEKEYKRVDLFGGPVAFCNNTRPTRAYIKSVTPSSPCNKKCFALWPCGGDNEFCLKFLASQGSHNHDQTQEYTLTIECTDDVDPPSAAETMTVTVVPNTPPVFVPSSPLTVSKTINGLTTAACEELYQVNTNDIDGDAVYYTMSTSPNTDLLEIGRTNGKIKATKDLRFLCDVDEITATVTAKDRYNTAIGELTIIFSIDPNNKSPLTNNLGTTVSVDENVGAGYTVLNLDETDTNTYGAIFRNMRSITSAGMDQYELDGNVLKTRIDPNYERSDTRNVRLYFDLHDGFCKSATYVLDVNINDVNEPPEWRPEEVFRRKAYEEEINEFPGNFVYDEDIGDTHVFTQTNAPNNIDVDYNSGHIISTSDIDLDPNTEGRLVYIAAVVTDSGGLTDTTGLWLYICDANDNPPQFLSNTYTVAATECTDLGSVIGRVTGKDDDSNFQFNDEIYFGGGGGKMRVMSNGDVVLTQKCNDGESNSGSATIDDQGLYPRPLSGVPATLTLTCGPCPPPVTPAPVVPTTAAPPVTTAGTPTARTIGSTSSGGSDMDTFLAWLIPAIILGLLWLALTMWFCYRYCCPCRNPCVNRCKRKPRPPKVKVKTPPKPKKVTPKKPGPLPKEPEPPKPEPPKPPKPPPEPEPDPYHFGFWKTNYTDQDKTKEQMQRPKPLAIENMPPAEVVARGNEPPPDNLKIGNPVPNTKVTAPPLAPGPPALDGPAEKKKCCTIL